MASNLPAVINNNNQLANTLRSLFNQNTNSQQQIMMMRRIFGPNFNNNNNNQRPMFENNGAEDFFLKDSMLEMHGRMENIQKTLEDMNENIKSMVELEEESNEREEEDFLKEQREEKQEKREVKQISLLEKILKQMGNAGLGFMNEDWANTFDTGSSSFGGGMLGSLMAGSGVTLLKGLLKKAGVAGMVYGAVSGAFDATRITGGSDLTGIAGAGRILGSSIAGLISIMTFGLIDSKDIYNFMTTTIPDAAMSVFETAKKTVTDTINGVDKSLEKWLGNNYKIVKTSLAEKMDKINNIGKDVTSKAFSIITGVVDKTYNYGLDLINWIDGISAPPELKQNDVIDNISTTQKALNIASGGVEKANLLAETAKSRSSNEDIKKTTGYCFRGVKRTLFQSGLVDKYLGGEYAYQAADEFKKLGWQEFTDGWQTDNPNQVKSLPPGYLVVWNKDPNKAGDAGHVAITMGDGKEFSDHEQSIDSSIRKRGAFGYRIFAPYKSFSGEMSDKADSWVYDKLVNMPSNLYQNMKSFVTGQELDTTSAEDNRAKTVITEANKPQDASTVKVEPVSSPSVNIVNNNSTIVPQDTSTSMNPFEWGWVKSLLPNRKF